MDPLKNAGDELLGYVMGEILVLRHYKPTVGGNEIVYLARDRRNFWDDEAIRVVNLNNAMELVGYLEHAVPCVLCGLLYSSLITIHGFVPEIEPAELNGVNVPCRIDIYSRKKDFEIVKSAITSGGLQFFWPPVDDKEEETKKSVLGGDCGIFHNKTADDVWDYIRKNNRHDLADTRFVICDEKLEVIFRKPRVMIPDFFSLLKLLLFKYKYE